MAELGRAGESGWAPVQNLLAVRDIADLNDDADGVAAVDAALADLGYAV